MSPPPRGTRSAWFWLAPFAAAILLWAMAGADIGHAQRGSADRPAAAAAKKAENGIPVTSPLVREACASCHAADDKGQLSRISFQRNTPEGWQAVIRRMAALNGMEIDADTAREAVRYLSNQHGLAPEEVRPGAFEVERRIVDFEYTASRDAEAACKQCHSLGRVILQRRTREEWDLLVAMHRGFYPLVDTQAFRRSGPADRSDPTDGRPADTRHPVEKAIEHLAAAFPLETPEWAAWSATMRPPQLAGAWTVSAWEAGRGAIYGRMTVTSSPARPDELTTETTLVYARTGERQTRTGQAIVYTGFQWRGRSAHGNDEATALREVMFVDREWRTIDGRWFTGGYDELGLDVTLERLGGGPRVLGTDVTALRVGTAGQTVKIFGANLPAGLPASGVSFGPGVTVTRVEQAAADEATVTVDVAADAAPGMRDLVVAGAVRPKALAVHDSVDFLRVTPPWAMARVGGIVFPKAVAQFEARAFDSGADGRPDTADDIDLGLVAAAWSLEEFAATYDDDDVKYVGEIDARSGRFTPGADGPNPARQGNRNNVGDVYAVATYNPPRAAASAPPLRARAHLLVTVPLYMRWEPVRGPQ